MLWNETITTISTVHGTNFINSLRQSDVIWFLRSSKTTSDFKLTFHPILCISILYRNGVKLYLSFNLCSGCLTIPNNHWNHFWQNNHYILGNNRSAFHVQILLSWNRNINLHFQCTTVCPMNYDVFCILLWFVISQFYPYPSGLFHRHWGNHMIAPVPVKQPWRIWTTQIQQIHTYHQNKTTDNKTVYIF